MAQQTAVEWLQQQYNSGNGFERLLTESEFEQAKAMEKEQMIDAFGVGCQVEATRLIEYHQMAEQYYNEKYGK